MLTQKLVGLKVKGLTDFSLQMIYFFYTETVMDCENRSIMCAILQLVWLATSVVMCPSRRAGVRIGGSSGRPAISLWSTTGLKP